MIMKMKQNVKLYVIIAILLVLLAVLNGRQAASWLIGKILGTSKITYSQRYRARVSEFKAMNRTQGGIVFLGDSLTDYVNFDDFFPFQIINRGIAGDTTTGILSRLDEVISLKPGKLFILVGTNDIAYGSSAEKISGNIMKIISRVQENSPKTKIYLQSLFPTNNKKFSSGRPNSTIQAVNKELEKLAQKLNCEYINLYPLLLSQDGELDEKFTPDGLHLTQSGMSQWMKFVAPYVNE